MELDKIIIGFFSLIGLIFVAIIIYYLFRRYYETSKPTQTYPSPEFMKYIGAQCPDYWESTKNTDGTITCTNYSGLEVVPKTDENGGSECGNCTNEQIFDRITDWPLDKKNGRLMQRCMWKKCCNYRGGDGKNVAIPWIGLEGSC